MQETCPFMMQNPQIMQYPFMQQYPMMPQYPVFSETDRPGTIPGQQQQQTPVGTAGLEQYMYPQNLPEALKLIQEAVAGEAEDRQFYQYLIEQAPSKEDKEIITGIRDDEISHFALFRQVYTQLTGQVLPPPQNVAFEKPASYCDGLRRAIRGEQNAVRKYRKILYALQDRVQINILTGIITDEIRHGSLYNYLYAKNGCRV